MKNILLTAIVLFSTLSQAQDYNMKGDGDAFPKVYSLYVTGKIKCNLLVLTQTQLDRVVIITESVLVDGQIINTVGSTDDFQRSGLKSLPLCPTGAVTSDFAFE